MMAETNRTWSMGYIQVAPFGFQKMQLYVKNDTASVPKINQPLGMLNTCITSAEVDLCTTKQSTISAMPGPSCALLLCSNHLRLSLLLLIAGNIDCPKAQRQKYNLKAFDKMVAGRNPCTLYPKPPVPTNLTEQFLGLTSAKK